MYMYMYLYMYIYIYIYNIYIYIYTHTCIFGKGILLKVCIRRRRMSNYAPNYAKYGLFFLSREMGVL